MVCVCVCVCVCPTPPFLERIDVVAIVVSWERYACRLLKNNSI